MTPPPMIATSQREALIGSQPARAIPKHEFLDLSGGCLRQLAEDHRARHLVVRDVLAAPRDDFGRGEVAGARFREDERAHALAPLLVGPRDDRRLLHLRMAIEA